MAQKVVLTSGTLVSTNGVRDDRLRTLVAKDQSPVAEKFKTGIQRLDNAATLVYEGSSYG